MSSSRRPTPVSAVGRSLAAGAVGTASMDLYWCVRYRASGGTSGPLQWEFGGEPDWEKVSAHWGYGVGWGVAFGIIAGSVPQRRVACGLALGPAVWLVGYAVLPLGGYYKPIWEYDARTLGTDPGGHLIYGGATAAAYRALP